MSERLYRSTTNKIVGGVCGGLGEYFDIDPVLIRIIMVLLFLAKGLGILAYIIAWIIIPKRPLEVETVSANHDYSSSRKYLPGLILIAVGIILLIRENWFWFDWGEFWPVILIVIGLFFILRRNHRDNDKEAPHVNVGQQHGNAQNGGSIS